MEPKAAPFSRHQSVRFAKDNGINVCLAPPHVCLSYGISGPSDSRIITWSLHFAYICICIYVCVCVSTPYFHAISFPRANLPGELLYRRIHFATFHLVNLNSCHPHMFYILFRQEPRFSSRIRSAIIHEMCVSWLQARVCIDTYCYILYRNCERNLI